MIIPQIKPPLPCEPLEELLELFPEDPLFTRVTEPSSLTVYPELLPIDVFQCL